MRELIERYLEDAGPVLGLTIGPESQTAVLAMPGRAIESWPRLVMPLPLSGADASLEFWKSTLASFGLSTPTCVLAAAREDFSGDDTRRMAWLGGLLEEHPAPSSWMEEEADTPRLSALQAATGGLVADFGAAVVLGALADSAIARRSFRQGVMIVHVDRREVFAALVYRGLVRGVFEHRTESVDADSLAFDLDEFRRFWLPPEKVQAAGGHGTVYGPPCEEAGGYVPTYVLGENRLLLEGSGQFAAPFGDMAASSCVGLVWAAALAHAGASITDWAG